MSMQAEEEEGEKEKGIFEYLFERWSLPARRWTPLVIATGGAASRASRRSVLTLSRAHQPACVRPTQPPGCHC
jgi:hypothetical protein